MNNLTYIKSILREDQLLGNLFIPNGEFYSSWNSDDYSLKKIYVMLAEYLKIDTEAITVEFREKLQSAGLYINENQKTIYISSVYKNNVFDTAAILAHELMHHYLIDKKNILLEDRIQNELLTDLATINAGLGIIVLNGFYHYFGWHEMLISLSFGEFKVASSRRSFGYFNPFYYGKLFKTYVRDHNINRTVAFSHILPNSRIFLGIALHRGIARKDVPLYIKLSKNFRSYHFIRRLVQVVLVLPLGIIFLISRTFVSLFKTEDIT